MVTRRSRGVRAPRDHQLVTGGGVLVHHGHAANAWQRSACVQSRPAKPPGLAPAVGWITAVTRAGADFAATAISRIETPASRGLRSGFGRTTSCRTKLMWLMASGAAMAAAPGITLSTRSSATMEPAPKHWRAPRRIGCASSAGTSTSMCPGSPMARSIEYRPVRRGGQQHPATNRFFANRDSEPGIGVLEASEPPMTFDANKPLCHAGSPEPKAIGAGELLVHRLETVSSTNDLAKQWLGNAGTDGPAAWVAKVQTAGRGTRGRSWASPEGGLWMSLAVPLSDTTDTLAGLGMRVGLAIARAVRGALPDDRAPMVRLRWPNDLIAMETDQQPRKLGGTIIEQAHTGIVIGVGVNVNHQPPRRDDAGTPLRTPAMALADLAERQLPIDGLADAAIRELARLVPVPGLPAGLHKEIEGLLYRPESPVRVTGRDGTEQSGIIRGLSSRPESLGALLLKTTDGRMVTVSSGELG